MAGHSNDEEDDHWPGDQSQGPHRLSDDSQSVLPEKKLQLPEEGHQ